MLEYILNSLNDSQSHFPIAKCYTLQLGTGKWFQRVKSFTDKLKVRI